MHEYKFNTSVQFAMALPGSTPSTQHLAKKKQPVEEEECATPYYSESPQAEAKAMSRTNRVTRAASVNSGSTRSEEKTSKSLLKGFKKLLSRN